MRINNVTLKGIVESLDHEDFLYIEKANIYLNNKKVGTYAENYMNGPSDEEVDTIEHTKEIEKVAIAYFDKYPYGFRNDNRGFTLKDLYSNSLVEGLCTELVELYRLEKEAKKAFKKGYKYYVETKKCEYGTVDVYYVPDDKNLQKLKNDGLILSFIVDRDKDIFSIDV